MRFVCLVAALALGFLQATEPSRAPRNAAEFDELFKQVSNWGRWGKDDQLGSVNLITAAKRKQALALAKTGVSVSLAHNPLTERAEDNSNPFEHTMLRGNNMDRYAVSYHGYAHSHIDALCHILYKDQTYNGYPRAEVNTEKGCTKLGIDNLKQGIVSRGILIDAPRLKGVEYLEPGTPLYAEDVEAWEKKAGVKIGAGDVVLLRTGRWSRRAKLGPWNVGQNAAGFHASIAPWFKTRGVAIVGSDVAEDVPAVARRRDRAAAAYAADHRDGREPARQSGSRSGRRNRRQTQSLGIHDHGRAGAGHRRHRVSGECAGYVLTVKLGIRN
jgi:kynurenine formamidase